MIVDVAGRRIRRIAGGWAAAGPHNLFWDGRDEAGRPVPHGVYLLRVDGRRAPARAITVMR